MFRVKPCKECGSTWHTRMSCPFRPRKPLLTRKPMAKMGRVGKETESAVARWKRLQKANHQGYYECYICHRLVPYLMAEHVKSKVRHPDQRTDLTNLRPVCADCNAEKGSHDND